MHIDHASLARRLHDEGLTVDFPEAERRTTQAYFEQLGSERRRQKTADNAGVAPLLEDTCAWTLFRARTTALVERLSAGTGALRGLATPDDQREAYSIAYCAFFQPKSDQCPESKATLAWQNGGDSEFRREWWRHLRFRGLHGVIRSHNKNRVRLRGTASSEDGTVTDGTETLGDPVINAQGLLEFAALARRIQRAEGGLLTAERPPGTVSNGAWQEALLGQFDTPRPDQTEVAKQLGITRTTFSRRFSSFFQKWCEMALREVRDSTTVGPGILESPNHEQICVFRDRLRSMK